MTKNFAASGFRKLVDYQNMLKSSNRTNLLSDQSNQLLLDSSWINTLSQHNKSNRDLSFELLDLSNNCSLNDLASCDQHLFHTCCGQSVTSSIDDIIESGHNVQIPIFIIITSITCSIISRSLFHVLLNKSFVIVVQSKHK